MQSWSTYYDPVLPGIGVEVNRGVTSENSINLLFRKNRSDLGRNKKVEALHKRSEVRAESYLSFDGRKVHFPDQKIDVLLDVTFGDLNMVPTRFKWNICSFTWCKLGFPK